jgi:hypothetical protein
MPPHRLDIRACDLDQNSEDTRAWTWESNPMGEYIEWTVRFDGALRAGGIEFWHEDGAHEVVQHYMLGDIESQGRMADLVLFQLYGTAYGDRDLNDFSCLPNGVSEERHVKLDHLSHADIEALLDQLFED